MATMEQYNILDNEPSDVPYTFSYVKVPQPLTTLTLKVQRKGEQEIKTARLINDTTGKLLWVVTDGRRGKEGFVG